MDITASIHSVIRASFIEINDILEKVNKDMQSSKGNEIIKKQKDLLYDIKQMYDIIYKPALDMGIEVMKDDYNGEQREIYVENACHNLKKAYEYFQNPPIITKVEYETDLKEIENGAYIPPKTDWLTLDEVCNEFRLSRNNVKNRKWRNENNFPYHQDGAYSSVQYNRQEINKWMRQHKK